MSSPILPAQMRTIHSLRRAAGLAEDAYRAMLYGTTNGRTTSARGLYATEAADLIEALRRYVQGPKPGTEADAANRMRRKLIAIAYRMYPALDKAECIQRLDAWCKQYGYGHKPLNSYTAAELPRLLSQYQQVYHWFLNATNATNTENQ